MKGIVVVSFVVGKDGHVKNVNLFKGVNRYADEVVLQSIAKMPKWEPAIQNGRFVDQYKEVSIQFNIQVIE